MDDDYGGTVAMRPRPTAVQVSKIQHGGQTVATAISRQWAPGDAARCRLCERCGVNATGNNCLIVARGVVSNQDAVMYPCDDYEAAKPQGSTSSVAKLLRFPG